ncbi:MAG: nucleotidyltransferase domain-containing protein [bacterium]|nr:nucleotidyltransferase domain-containing protein [bacterium]
MNDTIIKAQKFIDLVRNSGIFVSNASVFGSWAKGKASEDSDIDICVVSSDFGKDYIEEMVRLREIALKIDSRIEPIPFNPQDINDPYGSLASEIRKNSICLK